MSKYTRSNFYNQESVDSVTELDLSTNSWNDFKPLRQGYYYTISDRDLRRPDLISFYNYGRIDYWWIIAKVNNVDDFFNDLTVGDVLFIPDKLDIEDHFVENANKR